MSQNALDKFGQILMLKVRDETITDWGMIVSGKMLGEHAERMRKIFQKLSSEELQIIDKLVPEVVDTVLHHLLWTIEQQDDLILSIRDHKSVIDLKRVSDGLPGELYTNEGWIARFSKQ